MAGRSQMPTQVTGDGGGTTAGQAQDHPSAMVPSASREIGRCVTAQRRTVGGRMDHAHTLLRPADHCPLGNAGDSGGNRCENADADQSL